MPKWNHPRINLQGFVLFLFFTIFVFFCFFCVELHYEVTAVTQNVLFAKPSDDLPDD